jgi:hypothetical protein
MVVSRWVWLDLKNKDPKKTILRKDRAKAKKNSKIQIMLICVDSTWIGTDENSVVM